MSQTKKTSMAVIALIVVCVVLAAGFIGALALYLPNQAAIDEKDQTIASLNQQIQAFQAQIAQTPDPSIYTQQIANLNSQLSSLNSTLANLNSQYITLQDIVELQKTAALFDDTFEQDVNTTTTIYADSLQYAGYIEVVATSNSSQTYAQLTYVFAERTFSFNQTLAKSGTALFAVLPGAVELKIGNVGQADAVAVNATATYYY